MASTTTESQENENRPFREEESVIHGNLSISSNGNPLDHETRSPSPESHHESAADILVSDTSKGDSSTRIGLNDTALSEKLSSIRQGDITPFDTGKSLPDGRRKRPWMTFALLVLGAVAVAVIITSITIFVVRSHQQEASSSSAEFSSPELGFMPSLEPTAPLSIPTTDHSKSPNVPPTRRPRPPSTSTPQASPTITPQASPTIAPQASPTSISNPAADASSVAETYVPGNLTRQEVGLLLSEGLRARIIATSGGPIRYQNGTFSTISFHQLPDFGATFVDTRPFNEGGWVYTSNSEMKDQGQGGVGSLTFNKEGNIIDYRMVLQNTTMNCGGGATPWGTWVSCEEIESYGQIYQVDPFGEIPAQAATIGSQLGRWESFAYDVRDPQDPKFFATEDYNKGTVRRFRPEKSLIDWDNPWNMLHVNGTIDYLIVHLNENLSGGTFEWVDDIELARNNARSYYPQTEGVDAYGGMLYVACKGNNQLFMFDLDNLTYNNHSTVSGLFDGSPDQIVHILDDNPSDLLYFTEDGGVDAGVHARDEQGRYLTIFEGPSYIDDVTGLAFSPDGRHLYVAYQKNGLVFDIWREDGFSFGAKTLNVHYHRSLSSQP